MSIGRFSARNEISNLLLTPVEFLFRERPTEQFVHEPHPIGIKHIALAVPSDLLDLSGEDHALDPATVHFVRLSAQPEYLTDLIQLDLSPRNVRAQYVAKI